MLTSYAVLAPHLPTLLVDQHRRHRTPMLVALAAASERLRSESPEAMVILSARWTATGPFLVDADRHHPTITDYSGFGVEVRYDCVGHPTLARALVDAGVGAGVRVGVTSRGVDSGATVPLHFLVPEVDVPVVPLSLAPRSAPECRQWGKAVRGALTAWPQRVAFVIGGVLSHNTHAWNLKREVPEARELDERVLSVLRDGRWSDLENCDPCLARKAQPEAELRHLDVLRGFLSDHARGEVRCYESGPGVGAALVEFPVAERVGVGPADYGP